MPGKIIETTRRDGVICTLRSTDERLELTVVDLKTGAPTGTVSFPPGAAGALIWTLQSVYDEPENFVAKSTSEKTETKKTKKRAKKEQ